MARIDDECRFRSLYEAHYSQVLAYALRRTDRARAQDVTSETFLTAWRRLDQAIEGGLPWLYRTAALVLNNVRRSDARAERTFTRLESWREPDRQSELVSREEEFSELYRALAALSSSDREILQLVNWEDLPLKAVALSLGISPAATSVRLHRARRRLRALLASPNDATLPPARTLKERCS